VTWDDRLISRDRALALTGRWPLTATYELAELSQFEMEGGGEPIPDRWQVNLRCSTARGWRAPAPGPRGAAFPGDHRTPCGQSVAMLAAGGQAFVTNVEDIMSGILRHMVMAHDVPLSGAGKADDSG
jgi:hypothetical protein